MSNENSVSAFIERGLTPKSVLAVHQEPEPVPVSPSSAPTTSQKGTTTTGPPSVRKLAATKQVKIAEVPKIPTKTVAPIPTKIPTKSIAVKKQPASTKSQKAPAYVSTAGKKPIATYIEPSSKTPGKAPDYVMFETSKVTAAGAAPKQGAQDANYEQMSVKGQSFSVRVAKTEDYMMVSMEKPKISLPAVDQTKTSVPITKISSTGVKSAEKKVGQSIAVPKQLSTVGAAKDSTSKLTGKTSNVPSADPQTVENERKARRQRIIIIIICIIVFVILFITIVVLIDLYA